jgi:hypothetical protein
LSKCDDFGHRALAAPFPALDNLFLEVPEMSDQATERSTATAKKDQ